MFLVVLVCLFDCIVALGGLSAVVVSNQIVCVCA